MKLWRKFINVLAPSYARPERRHESHEHTKWADMPRINKENKKMDDTDSRRDWEDQWGRWFQAVDAGQYQEAE